MRHTILLADDSPTIQRLVNQTFADSRFDIVTVNNGDAAVRQFDEIEPDIVLADIYMPGKNGYEVCAYVKAHASLSDTPVILLVGAFDAFDEAIAKQGGATAHITKPFEPRALIDMVVSALPEGAKSRKSANRDRSARKEAPTAVEAVLPEVPLPPAAPIVSVPAATADPVPAVVSSAAPVQTPRAAAVTSPADAGDLLGLENLFQPEVVKVSAQFSEAEINKIADRVIQKLSSQVIESVAWDVVPDIAVKILRDELKKTTHEG
jgi:CheY-like chemotaxis protein